MKDLIITPDLAAEAEYRNKPALLIISKMNVALNVSASKRLALKPGAQFQLILKDGRLFYKDAISGGFQIKTVNNKGSFLINKGLHPLLCESYKHSDKSFRFQLGDFKDGLRELKQIEA